MYNEALVNALNSDRQRAYDELELLRRQREIMAERAIESAVTSDAHAGRRVRGHHRAAPFRHLATR